MSRFHFASPTTASSFVLSKCRRLLSFLLFFTLMHSIKSTICIFAQVIDSISEVNADEHQQHHQQRQQKRRQRQQQVQQEHKIRKDQEHEQEDNIKKQQRNTHINSSDLERMINEFHTLYDGNYKYATADSDHHMLLFQLDYYYNQSHHSQQNHTEKHRNRQLEQNVHSRVLIRYNENSDTIYPIIERLSNYIYYHFETVQLVAADISYSTFVLLQRNENITHIEYDGVYAEQGILIHQYETKTTMTNQTDQLDDWESSFEMLMASSEDDRINKTSDKVGLDSLKGKQEKQQNLKENHDTRKRSLVEQTTYGIKMVQADQLSYNVNTKTKIPVCIIDTGVSTSHPDLQGNQYNGADRLSLSSNQWLYWNTDKRGHGTHVTGIISARANNNEGIRGIDGYGAIPIYVTRGLDDSGNARESDIYNAMQQCYESGAKIISLSLCSPSKMSSTTISYIDTLYNQYNMILVAAAGNSKGYTNQYPAAYNNVISVSSVDINENFSSDFSNYGPTIELAAPGSNILSTSITYNPNTRIITNIYSIYSGTSMSTPHVSGIIAILWSYYPTCTPTQIRYALAITAKDKGTVGCDDYYGYGIPQLYNAYQFLTKNSCALSKRGFKRWGANVGDGTCSIL